MRTRTAGRHLLTGSVLGVALGLVALAFPAGAAHQPSKLVTARSALLAAVRSSLGASSADITLDAAISAPGQSSYNVIHVAGDLDFKKTAGNLTVTVPATSGKGTTTVREILDNGTVFLQVNGQWYSTSIQRILQNNGVSGGSLSQGNPTQVLVILEQEGAQVKRIGPATLNGLATTEYRAVVNLDRANAIHHAQGGPTVSTQTLQQFKKLVGGSTLPVKVWVDQQGRVRQMVMNWPLSRKALAALGLSGAPPNLSESFTMGLANFGVAVVVTPPPPSQVRPLPTGAGKAQGGAPLVSRDRRSPGRPSGVIVAVGGGGRAPGRLAAARDDQAIVADHGRRAHCGLAEALADGIDGRRHFLPGRLQLGRP
jgi:hypothetical protein